MITKKKSVKKKGKLFLIGAGPGDPDLITVKGLRALQEADTVVYDYLAAPALLKHIRPDAEKIYVGKKAGAHTLSQDGINALLISLLGQGKNVARLKGGDPFVFGRGSEEILALKGKYPFDVIPGVTSGIAAAAYAGIPVTHRGIATSVALITGHEDPTKESSGIDWQGLARGADTLVFYMGVSNLENIAGQLIKHGRPASTPAAVVRWGTTPSHRAVSGTLGTIAAIVRKAGITAPAVTIVGNVAALRGKLQWFERLPLLGKRIVITRTREQASGLSRRLSALGAQVMELPTIAIHPLVSDARVQNAVSDIGTYDWIIFTSPNAVSSFLGEVVRSRGDIRVLGTARIASIGPETTRELEKFFITAEITSAHAVAEGLVKALEKCDTWKGRRVLMPRAAAARDVVPQSLKKWGARVDVVPVYRTEKPADADPEIIRRISEGDYDLVTFTSASTFDNFMALVGKPVWNKIKRKLACAAIGPVTGAAIRAAGVTPAVEARVHTIDGLVKAIERHCTHDRHI